MAVTYYDVQTQQEQLEEVQNLKKLYELQKERLLEKIKIEKRLLEQLASPANQAAAVAALQALNVPEELDRAQGLVAEIIGVYNGIEAARRAAPTPEGHPPIPNTSGGYSVQTGARTETRIGVEQNKMRASSR
jgi:hypothetical protein